MEYWDLYNKDKVKLNKIDYTLLTVSLIGLGVYVYYFLGGVFFA